MGQGGSNCRDWASNDVPACPQPKDVDWLTADNAKYPCSIVDKYMSSPELCVDNKCPLFYSWHPSRECVCQKKSYTDVPALKGYNKSYAHRADCCDGTADRTLCASEYCRKSAASGAGPGCARFMEDYCTRKQARYPKLAKTGQKIQLQWDEIDFKTDPDQFIFMWQEFPRCACYDTDGQKFDALRRHVMYSTIDGQEVSVALNMGDNPANCWFKPCKDPYIYGQPKSCTHAVSVCGQFAKISQGTSSMSPVTLTNDCQANAGVEINTEEQTSTVVPQQMESESEADKAYTWFQDNKKNIFTAGVGVIGIAFIICCCCMLLIILASQ